MSTTKGTGGDLLILEEAAYVDPGFFYETVAPLLCMSQTTMIAISTLTSSVNFYSRLIKMRNKTTGAPLFNIFQVELACPACIEKGAASQCVHRLHLIPRWQSSDRHTTLKTIMQDRPDLIESELAGLAFDAAQTVFRSTDLEVMFSQPAPPLVVNEDVHIFIDPAAGGPGSDYAILSITRHKGLVTVRRAVLEYRAERAGGRGGRGGRAGRGGLAQRAGGSRGPGRRVVHPEGPVAAVELRDEGRVAQEERVDRGHPTAGGRARPRRGSSGLFLPASRLAVQVGLA